MFTIYCVLLIFKLNEKCKMTNSFKFCRASKHDTLNLLIIIGHFFFFFFLENTVQLYITKRKFDHL